MNQNTSQNSSTTKSPAFSTPGEWGNWHTSPFSVSPNRIPGLAGGSTTQVDTQLHSTSSPVSTGSQIPCGPVTSMPGYFWRTMTATENIPKLFLKAFWDPFQLPVFRIQGKKKKRKKKIHLESTSPQSQSWSSQLSQIHVHAPSLYQVLFQMPAFKIYIFTMPHDSSIDFPLILQLLSGNGISEKT